MLPLEQRVMLASSFIDPPALPQVFLDTTYVPGAGQVRNVAANGNLQATIDIAQPGDTIVLSAGATYTGNFSLPNKAGPGWITIRSSAMDDLPATGTRVTPAHSSRMAKLMAPALPPDVNGARTALHALTTTNGAHHYRFIGIEFTIDPLATTNSGVVVLGSGSQTVAQTPNNLVFDRCYIHGNPTANVQNGMRLNSASTAVIDSYFDQCQANGTAFESHCIGGYNGPGPYKLVNNTFSSATIPVIFGGALTTNANIPSDMEIRNNHFTRPLSWYSGHPSYVANNWYVKNLFELKNAQRVLFDGNVLEHNWPHTGATADGSPQKGYAILLTTRGQKNASGTELMPQNVVQDITITNNIIRKSTVGLSVYGAESSGAKRIKVANNLFDEINNAWSVNQPSNDRVGMFVQFQTVGDTSFDHNTIINNGDIMFANGDEVADLDFTNNITNHNAARTTNPNHGINGAGTNIGDPTLIGKFVQYTATKNLMVNGSNHSQRYTGTAFGATAAGNFFPTATTTPGDFSGVGFTSLANRDYRLAPSSLYNNAATDGTDLGANIDALDAAVSGAISLPITGAAGNDTYYLKRNGSLLEIYNNATGTGTPILRDQFVYYESLHFNTGDGNDRVIIDRAGGNPLPAGGVFVDGAAASASDVVQIIGGGAAATYKPSGAVAGRGVVTLAGSTAAITLLGTEELEFSNLSGLTLVTPNAADTLTVSAPTAGTNRISGSSGAMTFRPATLSGAIPLTIDVAANDAAGGSVDSITISAAAGSSVRFISGAGHDSMTVSSGAISFDSDLASDSSSLALAVASAGSVQFNATQHLRSLTVDGLATMSAHGGRLLVTKALTIGSAGRLDLNDNDMLLDYSGPSSPHGSWDGSAYTGVAGMLQSGQSIGGTWDGPGIVTSMPQALEGLTTLGLGEAADVLFLTAGESTLWQGEAVDATTLIVKYTYTGDANLDGTIDGADYGVIDNWVQFPGTNHYANGDFNYDGVIDGADYGFIDNAIQLQGSPL
jgi:hypothetical protein